MSTSSHARRRGGRALPILVLLAAAIAVPVLSAPARRGPRTAAPKVDIASLERARDAAPKDLQARLALGEAYYVRARHALDHHDAEGWAADLERATAEWLAALRIDPENPAPHTWMGIADAYRGRLDSALENFSNARRLAPRAPHTNTNVAQILIYRGKPDLARRFLKQGRRLGASPTQLGINETLLAWQAGRLDDAAWEFEEAYRLDPEEMNIWDGAPADPPIRTFSDFTRYCCASPSCGPYMKDACRASHQQVAVQEVPVEVARRELVLEMERRRELRRIYDRRRDLGVEIQVEEEEPGDAKMPTAPAN